MDKKTKIRVWISCTCFLALIYGIATLDQGHRKQVDQDIAAMAEQEEEKEEPVMAEEKIMYITFDDGPSKHTQEVLDILAKYKIKATFFVTGENPEYADMITEIHNQGHALGIHTFSHEYSNIYASEEAYFEDVDKVAALIKEKAGIDTHFLRFPGGSSNTVSRKYSDGIMTRLSKAVEEKGYQYYDWNVHNGDGDPGISSDGLYNQLMEELKGKKEAMVLMHDGGGNANTVASLDACLKSMMQQGWTFKTIEENGDTPIFHHHIAN